MVSLVFIPPIRSPCELVVYGWSLCGNIVVPVLLFLNAHLSANLSPLSFCTLLLSLPITLFSHHSLMIRILIADLGVHAAHHQQKVLAIRAFKARLHLLTRSFSPLSLIGALHCVMDKLIYLPFTYSFTGFRSWKNFSTPGAHGLLSTPIFIIILSSPLNLSHVALFKNKK